MEVVITLRWYSVIDFTSIVGVNHVESSVGEPIDYNSKGTCTCTCAFQRLPYCLCLQVPIFELCFNLLTVTFPLVVRYNEEKEKKAEQEKKQRQLEAIELARKLEEEEKKKNGAVLLHSLTYFNNAPS